MFKYALFLLVAVAAVQSYPQPSSDVQERDFQDILNKIKEIIQQIKDSLGGLGGNIEDIINKIKDAINDIMGGAGIQDIIKKIEEWVKDKFGQVTAKVEECIVKEMPKINDLAKEVQAAEMACVQKAEGVILSLEDDVKQLGSKVLGIAKDLAEKAAKCLVSGNISECLSGVYDEAMAQYENIKKDISDLITKAQGIGTEALNQLSQCMTEVANDTAAKEQAILKDIEKCVLSKNYIRAF